jgi:hypothetical protein
MNVQYLFLGILEIDWASYHIFQQFEEYSIALKKLRNNTIFSLGYIAIPSLGHITISFKVSQKYIGLHNISFDM